MTQHFYIGGRLVACPREEDGGAELAGEVPTMRARIAVAGFSQKQLQEEKPTDELAPPVDYNSGVQEGDRAGGGDRSSRSSSAEDGAREDSGAACDNSAGADRDQLRCGHPSSGANLYGAGDSEDRDQLHGGDASDRDGHIPLSRERWADLQSDSDAKQEEDMDFDSSPDTEGINGEERPRDESFANNDLIADCIEREAAVSAPVLYEDGGHKATTSHHATSEHRQHESDARSGRSEHGPQTLQRDEHESEKPRRRRRRRKDNVKNGRPVPSTAPAESTTGRPGSSTAPAESSEAHQGQLQSSSTHVAMYHDNWALRLLHEALDHSGGGDYDSALEALVRLLLSEDGQLPREQLFDVSYQRERGGWRATITLATGRQLVCNLRTGQRAAYAAAMERAMDLLADVGLHITQTVSSRLAEAAGAEAHQATKTH